MPQNRDKSGRFVKGNNGNPGGRPKMPEDVKQAFIALTPDAVQVIAELMTNANTNAKVRLDAATYVVDRAYGKPKAVIDDDAGALSKLDKLLEGITDAAQR